MRTGFSRRVLAAVALAWAATCAGSAVRAESETTMEYKLKATYLFNFAQFTEWPTQALAAAKAPIVIGVLGDDEFGPFLDALLRSERVQDHPLVIRRSQTVADLKSCHIVFVSRSERRRIAQIVTELASAAALLVGEVDGFANAVGHINFFLEGNKVRFEVNPQAIKRCGITIAAKVLRLGRVVNPEDD